MLLKMRAQGVFNLPLPPLDGAPKPPPPPPPAGRIEPYPNNDDLDNLRHMLGATTDVKKRDWGYRNRFAPGGKDIESMQRLENAGLVIRGRPYHETHFYHATARGCEAVGLNPAQTERALED